MALAMLEIPLGIDPCIVVPANFGIRLDGGRMKPLLLTGDPVPASGTHPLQIPRSSKELTIEIFRGGAIMAVDNKQLGRLVLHDLPTPPFEQLQVMVRFTLGHHGILRASVSDAADTFVPKPPAAKIEDEHNFLALALAYVSATTGDPREARMYMKRLEGYDPRDKTEQAALSFVRGRLAERSNELEDALHHYRAALLYDSSCAPARDALEALLARMPPRP